jgi:SnoaL-like domain
MQNTDGITLVTQLIVRERDSRDMGFWNRMLDCFHPDALIDISWIRGNPQRFVDGSRDMAARGMKATHRLGPVLVTMNGDKAVATVVGSIDIPTELEGKQFHLSAHCQMFYRVEHAAGEWRILGLTAIYRRDELTPVVLGQMVTMPQDLFDRFRPSYRHLAWSQHLLGYEVNMELPGIDRPDTVRAVYQSHYSWLGLPVPD